MDREDEDLEALGKSWVERNRDVQQRGLAVVQAEERRRGAEILKGMKREDRWHRAKALALLPAIWTLFVLLAGLLWAIHWDRRTATEFVVFIVSVWLFLWALVLRGVLLAAGLQDHVSHQMDILKVNEARWRGQEPSTGISYVLQDVDYGMFRFEMQGTIIHGSVSIRRARENLGTGYGFDES